MGIVTCLLSQSCQLAQEYQIFGEIVNSFCQGGLLYDQKHCHIIAGLVKEYLPFGDF